LSTSAASMLSVWDDLSKIERDRVRNKISAETRASQPLDPYTDLHILYHDHDICVTYKPSGILSVPGPRRNPSLANLVYDILEPPNTDVDQMVVHRLDMDTSGVLVFALNSLALRKLHEDFRSRCVKKTYQALLVGHLPVVEVEIDLSLERDPFHVPFMRVARPKEQVVDDSNNATSAAIHPTFRKMMNQAPKPSKTELYVLAWEYLDIKGDDDNDGKKELLPVTRVELVPHTGRTHQLRVHCAALGYPIVGDDIYGYMGAGDCGIDRRHCATSDLDESLRQRIHELQIPLCLHAKELSFFHPRTGAPVLFGCQPPF
jgi:tRNA pseudouridine32 synthase/23S rRNA pseudouridine746 synthase